MVAAVQLGDRVVGDGHPCFVIAEAGVNHNGSKDTALKLVDAAKAAGADAVKFQLFRIEEQVSRNAPTADYQRAAAGFDNMFEMAQTYDLPWEAHRKIAEHCRGLGIQYMASCFDARAVDYVAELGVTSIKIASGEITNYPLLAHAAQKGKPLLLSTGMCSIEDVEGAVNHIRKNGDPPLVLLQCVSNYPATPASVNLRAMATLRSQFGTLVGYSDHTLGSAVSVAAVALGACVIEKHFTVDKSLSGPDHAMSLDPSELKDFVAAIRTAEAALGGGVKRPDESEIATAAVARRSLVTARAIRSGESLEATDVCLKRPATGIDPRLREQVIGKRVAVDIPADVPITWDMLD